MRDWLRTAAVLVLLIVNGACAAPPPAPVFDPDPMLHAPGGRIVFNRMCADEEPYRVKAYARMESPDGRARAVVAVLAGYRATQGKTVFVEVRIQRLKLEGGQAWRDAEFAIRLTGRGADTTFDGPMVGTYMGGAQGQAPASRRFRTGESATADWITFVEPDDSASNGDNFYYFGPDLGIKAADLGVGGPQDEFELTLALRNDANGRTLELPGPRVRVPERIWKMEPPVPKALGLVDVLNPAQEGGLFDVLGRGWKYRKCIEERRDAKRFLGPYAGALPGDGG